MAGNGYWRIIKEILGWIVETEKGNLLLSLKGKDNIISILGISPTRSRMAVKSLDRLIGKLWYMYLAVPDDIGPFCAMQVALTSAWSTNRAPAYFLARFHQYVNFWRDLCDAMDVCPTYLA